MPGQSRSRPHAARTPARPEPSHQAPVLPVRRLVDEPLGSTLRLHRRLHRRSQRDLAEQLCTASGMPTVSRHEISRWERGTRLPSAFWLHWLSQVLDIPVADLQLAAEIARHRRVAGVPPRSLDAVSTPWRIVALRPVSDGAGGIRLRPA